jgi:hypothetical protein
MTPDTWDGGIGGWMEDVDMFKILDWHREHNIFHTIMMRGKALEEGSMSVIEEEMKALSEYGKPDPKFSPGIAPVWHVPQPNVDAAVAAFKKYNKC